MSKNKEIVRILKAAKPLLATGDDVRFCRRSLNRKHEFICHALDEAGGEDNPASEIIQERIAPHGTLNAWVVHNVLGGNWNLVGERDMQEYRHRWLDELIREFSAKK